MNKDDYAKMKVRQDIAKAFIDKLDTVNVEDIGLIPAIEDYIMTGDKDFFEDYMAFRKIKDSEEKAKHEEELIKDIDVKKERFNAKLDEAKEECEHQIESFKNYLEEYKLKHSEIKESAMRVWEEVEKEDLSSSFMRCTAVRLRDYLTNEAKELLAESPLRGIFILDGSKLKKVQGIQVVKHKNREHIVLSTSEKDIEVGHRPSLPGWREYRLTSSIPEPFKNDRGWF